jgi:non-ribosomal peptide synthetase component F/NRPS condensation-like uncharacterized protein
MRKEAYMEELGKKDIEDILALTPMQEGMLFHYLKDPGSEYYFEQLNLKISGEIDADIFEKAWNFVIQTNEMLRAVFRWEKVEQPIQIILKEHRLQPRYFDLSEKDNRLKKNSLEKIKAKDRKEKFDLREIPFRITLCKVEADKYEMIISNHHILYDGWSNSIILGDFFCAYNDLIEGKLLKPKVKTKFKEFVKWLKDQDTKKQEEYWNEYLKGSGPGLDRAVPRKRKKGKELKNTDHHKFKFPAELKTKLDAFIKCYNITTASFLYGVWGVLLQNYHSSDDIAFDATVSGRSASTGIKGIENLVGLFINTLPMRVQTVPNEKAADFLSRMYRMVQEWAEFENSSPLPVREILDKCHKGSLFDSVVVIENYPLDSLTVRETAPLSLHSFSIVERTFYDLTVIITPLNGIEFNITYNNDLFDQTVISRLSNHLVSIAAEMVTHPGKALSEIEVWMGEEREKFLASIRTGRETETEKVEIAYTAPRDEVEEKVAAVWSEILNIDRDVVGIDNNFFDFGGHSLKASLVAAALHREFNVKVPLVEVFRRPTIRELAGYIKRAPGDTHTPLKPAGEAPYYPLSSVQKRMVAVQQMDPESTAYNVTSVMTIEGPLDKNRLEETFRNLLRRHESLRTYVEFIDGEPFQAIHAPDDVPFAIDFCNSATEGTKGKGGTEKIEEIHNSKFIIQNSFIRPFDLSGLPLLRVLLVPLEAEKHLLVLDMHHIITDSVSMAVFINEFSALYKGEPLSPLKYQYKDFACWQNDRMQSGALKPQEEYWLKEFSGELPVLNLSTDFPRPSIQSFAGDRLSFYLEENIIRQLRRLAEQTGATLFMTLLAVLNILLSRYAGQEDIIVGTTVAGRDHTDLQNIVGLFIETLALRNSPTGYKSFGEFLQEVRTNTLNAFENGAYPFRELMRKVGDAADVSRNPLFNVMLVVQNIDMVPVEIEGLTFTPVDFHRMVSKVDFTLEVFENETGVRFDLEYCTALFRQETMERLAVHFTNILNEVVNRPGVLLSEIDMLSDRERDRLLDEFSGNKDENPEGMHLKVHRLFEKQAELTPDHIAVVYEGKRLTYRELNEKADALSKVVQDL